MEISGKASHDIQVFTDFELNRRTQPAVLAQIGIFTLTFFITHFFRSQPSSTAYLSYAVFSLNGIRFLIGTQQNKIYRYSANLWRWQYKSLLLITAVGWGFLFRDCLLTYPLASFNSLIMMLVISGIASGSTTALHPNPKLAMGFVVLVLGIPLAELLFDPVHRNLALSVIYVIYLAYLITQIRMQHLQFARAREKEMQVETLSLLSREGLIIEVKGKIKDANPSVSEILGFASTTLLGQEVKQFLPGLAQADQQFLQAVRSDQTRVDLEIRAQDAEYQGTIARIYSISDVTEQTFSELLRRIASAANESSSVSAAIQICLNLVAEHFDWPVAHAYLLDEQSALPKLVSAGVWHLQAGFSLHEFVRASEEASFALGHGLPGRILQSGKALWIDDLQHDENFPRRFSLTNTRIQSGFGVPISGTDRVLGVLEFFSERVFHPHPKLLKLLGEAGQQLGHMIERKHSATLAQNAAELKTSEKRFRNLTETIPQIVWTATPAGLPDYFNQGWIDYTGVSVSEANRVGWDQAFHPDDLNRVNKTWQLAVRLGQLFEIECRVKQKDSDLYRWHLGRALPVRSELGDIERWFGTLTDIDDQKSAVEKAVLAEQTLAEAERIIRAKQEQLQAILNNSPAVIYVKDCSGKYQLVNQEFERLFEIGNQEVIGKTDFDMFPTEQARIFRANDERVIELEKAIREEEQVWIEGNLHTYLSAKFPIYGPDGVISAVGGISTDITERLKNQSERSQLLIREKTATEASRMKSDFLANMSHEIRTPINGVLGMTGLLLDSVLSYEQVQYASAIQRSGESLLTVVNDILDLSKVEAGKMELELTPFQLKAMCQDLERIYAPLAQRKGVQFQVSVTTDQSENFLGDVGRIRQVLNNFIGNAIKFTQQGKIEVEVTATSWGDSLDSSQLEFKVRDTGIGISESAQGKLFQAFSQADSSTTRKYGGTGLGLSIAKKLAELMGGEVGFKPALEGGSLFWLRIVLQNSEELHAQPHLESEENYSFENRFRVLVAEDNAVNQVITLKFLERMGIRADVVGNGLEALSALSQFPYDLVLMDCQMPELDGFEATRQVRSSSDVRVRKIPILALTAGAMKADEEKCRAAGMDDFLTKPIKRGSLQKKLKEWLLK